MLRGSLDVPAGVQAAIEYECMERSIPAVGLWAHVPHYVSAEMAPYPAAALALLDKLEITAGLHLPKPDLAANAERTRNRIDAALASNTDHLNMLHALEARHDEHVGESPVGPTGPLPSADELAAEVERYLREHNLDDDA